MFMKEYLEKHKEKHIAFFLSEKMLMRTLLFLLICSASTLMNAQTTKNIRGAVSEKNGEPVIGASISVSRKYEKPKTYQPLPTYRKNWKNPRMTDKVEFTYSDGLSALGNKTPWTTQKKMVRSNLCSRNRPWSPILHVVVVVVVHNAIKSICIRDV
jgi:hypothetical protein